MGNSVEVLQSSGDGNGSSESALATVEDTSYDHVADDIQFEKVGKAETGKYAFPKILSPKHRLVLRLYACGYPVTDISVVVSLTSTRIFTIISSPLGKEFLERFEAQLEGEFNNLYSKVVGVIRNGLDCPDLKIGLVAAKMWGQMSGRNTLKVELTAEDSVKELIEGGMSV